MTIKNKQVSEVGKKEVAQRSSENLQKASQNQSNSNKERSNNLSREERRRGGQNSHRN